MRIAAVDFGRKRLGLALSDPSLTLAVPQPVLARNGEWWAALLGWLRASEVGEVVVGLPRNMDGSSGPAAEVCRRFALELGERSGLPVVLLDERLTSVAASSALREGGVRAREQRGKLDSVAASLLLQVHLQRRGTALTGEGPAP